MNLLRAAGINKNAKKAAQERVRRAVRDFGLYEKGKIGRSFKIRYFGGSRPGKYRILAVNDWLPSRRGVFWGLPKGKVDVEDRKIYYVDLIGDAIELK